MQELQESVPAESRRGGKNGQNRVTLKHQHGVTELSTWGGRGSGNLENRALWGGVIQWGGLGAKQKRGVMVVFNEKLNKGEMSVKD